MTQSDPSTDQAQRRKNSANYESRKGMAAAIAVSLEEGGGPLKEPVAKAALANMADASTQAEWNQAISKLLAWALVRLAEARGEESDRHFKFLTALQSYIDLGFHGPLGRPTSIIRARWEAAHIPKGFSAPEAAQLQALAEKLSTASNGSPSPNSTKAIDKHRKRVKKAAQEGNIPISPGSRFGRKPRLKAE